MRVCFLYHEWVLNYVEAYLLTNILLRIYISTYLRDVGLWSCLLMMSLSGLGVNVILVS